MRLVFKPVLCADMRRAVCLVRFESDGYWYFVPQLNRIVYCVRIL